MPVTSRRRAFGYNALKLSLGKSTTLGGKGEKVYEIDQEKCTKDGECVDACPIGAIAKKDDGTFSVGDDCTDCGACEPVCDTQAIHPME